MASYKFISGPFFAGNSVLAIPGVYNGEALESVIENYNGKMDTLVLGTSLPAGGTATFPYLARVNQRVMPYRNHRLY